MPTISTLRDGAYLLHRRDVQKRGVDALRNDRTALNMLIKACGDIDVKRINIDHMTKVVQVLGHNKAPASFRTRYFALTVFFRYCRSRGLMERNVDVLEEVTVPGLVKAERRRLPMTQWPQLLDAAEHPRDRILIAIGLELALRGNEITYLRYKHLNLQDSEITVKVSKVRNGAEVFDVMPITASLDKELRRWLTWYTAQVGQVEEEHFLVPSKASNAWLQDPVTGRLVRDPSAWGKVQPQKRMTTPERNVQMALKAMGFNPGRGEGVHTLRRSAAREMFEQFKGDGFSHALRDVQGMLHHSEAKTTELYLGITADKVKRAERMKGKIIFPIFDEAPANVVPLFSKESAATGNS